MELVLADICEMFSDSSKIGSRYFICFNCYGMGLFGFVEVFLSGLLLLESFRF